MKGIHLMHNQVKAFLKQHLNQFEFFKSYIFLTYGYMCIHLQHWRKKFMYHMRAIITRGLYIYYPIFQVHFFVFKEVFSENSVLLYGQYSRAVCKQERVMMARVRYSTQLYCILVIIKLKRVNFLFDNVITFNCTQNSKHKS